MGYPDEKCCILLTRRTLPPLTDDPAADGIPPTDIPLPVANPSVLAQNSFAGNSLADINAFMRAHDHLPEDNTEDDEGEGYHPPEFSRWSDRGLYPSLWLVLDDAALASDTCVLCQQTYSPEEERMTDAFRAVRMQYCDIADSVFQLGIANIDFEDLIAGEDELEEGEEDIWKGAPIEAAGAESYEELLRDWREAGYVD
ncbi:hypothetical protein MKEN_00745100 [Mycena kentingensis (nom. inval.)]|nr:hypothetical protein MKEN_00745100 [Mycena kentingensis (nom. inval.)]